MKPFYTCASHWILIDRLLNFTCLIASTFSYQPIQNHGGRFTSIFVFFFRTWIDFSTIICSGNFSLSFFLLHSTLSWATSFQLPIKHKMWHAHPIFVYHFSWKKNSDEILSRRTFGGLSLFVFVRQIEKFGHKVNRRKETPRCNACQNLDGEYSKYSNDINNINIHSLFCVYNRQCW